MDQPYETTEGERYLTTEEERGVAAIHDLHVRAELTAARFMRKEAFLWSLNTKLNKKNLELAKEVFDLKITLEERTKEYLKLKDLKVLRYNIPCSYMKNYFWAIQEADAQARKLAQDNILSQIRWLRTREDTMDTVKDINEEEDKQRPVRAKPKLSLVTGGGGGVMSPPWSDDWLSRLDVGTVFLAKPKDPNYTMPFVEQYQVMHKSLFTVLLSTCLNERNLVRVEPDAYCKIMRLVEIIGHEAPEVDEKKDEPTT